jgi:hypothetical protein
VSFRGRHRAIKAAFIVVLVLLGAGVVPLCVQQTNPAPASIIDGPEAKHTKDAEKTPLDYGPVIPESSLEDPTLATADVLCNAACAVSLDRAAWPAGDGGA